MCVAAKKLLQTQAAQGGTGYRTREVPNASLYALDRPFLEWRTQLWVTHIERAVITTQVGALKRGWSRCRQPRDHATYEEGLREWGQGGMTLETYRKDVAFFM